MILVRERVEGTDRPRAGDGGGVRQATQAGERRYQVILPPGAGMGRLVGEVVAEIEANAVAALGEDQEVRAALGAHGWCVQGGSGDLHNCAPRCAVRCAGVSAVVSVEWIIPDAHSVPS